MAIKLLETFFIFKQKKTLLHKYSLVLWRKPRENDHLIEKENKLINFSI